VRARILTLSLLLAALCVFAVPSCSTPTVSAPSNAKLHVVATIFPLSDWLREVAGDDAEVHCLVDGAQSPHHFEPAVKDAANVTKAKALFMIGLGLDLWAKKLADNAGGGAKVFETAAWASPQKMGAARELEIHGKDEKDEDEEHHHHHGDLDPHYWLDPSRAGLVVLHMGTELGALDPAHRDAYATRAAAYATKLTELTKDVDKLAAEISPGAQLVIFHDAYGYLFNRLHLKIAAVVQVSPGVEPSVKDVAEAVKLIKSLGQRVIFREPGANDAALKALAQDLGATIETLDPIETGVSDAGKTYVERLSHDLKTLAAAIKKSEAKP
jgi:ABC-type Zn uptake system ZnuABC Zn-binding protein ZnuA